MTMEPSNYFHSKSTIYLLYQSNKRKLIKQLENISNIQNAKIYITGRISWLNANICDFPEKKLYHLLNGSNSNKKLKLIQ